MKEFLICKDCGSSQLQFCGWLRWDCDKQQFVPDGLEVNDPYKHMASQYAHCDECNEAGEGQAVWMETEL